jgi:hypothetical protein
LRRWKKWGGLIEAAEAKRENDKVLIPARLPLPVEEKRG